MKSLEKRFAFKVSIDPFDEFGDSDSPDDMGEDEDIQNGYSVKDPYRNLSRKINYKI